MAGSRAALSISARCEHDGRPGILTRDLSENLQQLTSAPLTLCTLRSSRSDRGRDAVLRAGSSLGCLLWSVAGRPHERSQTSRREGWPGALRRVSMEARILKGCRTIGREGWRVLWLAASLVAAGCGGDIWNAGILPSGSGTKPSRNGAGASRSSWRNGTGRRRRAMSGTGRVRTRTRETI